MTCCFGENDVLFASKWAACEEVVWHLWQQKNETAVETRAYSCACENARDSGIVMARAKHECCCTLSVISIKPLKEMLQQQVL